MAAVPEAEVARGLDTQQRRGPMEAALRALFEDAPLDTAAHQTTQPILFKQRPVAGAIVLSLRAAAPPVVSSLTLYALAQLYNIPSTEFLSALTILVTVLSIVLLQPSRHPSVELLLSRRRIAINLIGRWTALLAVLAIIAYATGYTPRYPQQVILFWAAATPLLVIAATLALHEIARRAICHPDNHRSVVFVGYNEASRYLAESFASRRELCMTVRGFFDDRSAGRLDAPTRVQILGALSELPAYVKAHGVDVIFISLPLRHVRRVHDLVEALGDTTASLYYLPDVGASELVHARAGEILGLPVIVMRESPFYGYRGAAKRVLDVIVAGGALIALAPLLLAIALGVKLTSRGPALFRQRRYALEGREIVIYKFRTMTVAEDRGWLAQARRDDPRVTPFGRFLRRWSLDEFPQLINVVQGTMSLVGPRPHAIGHNEEYRRLIRGYMVRHKALPGLTGLAQVKGFRGETRTLGEMQARVHYDLEYLRNWSLALDLKILLLTLPKLLKTDRAY
jgi:putative colanic acid biosynthesis UDP-glucose lipid carrier transferase